MQAIKWFDNHTIEGRQKIVITNIVVQPHIVGEEAVIANFPGDVEIVGVPPGETEICHLYPHSLPVTDPAVTKWFQRTLMDGLPYNNLCKLYT